MGKIFGLFRLLLVILLAVGVRRGTEMHDLKRGKETKEELAVASTDPRCTIRTKVYTKSVLGTSLAK